MVGWDYAAIAYQNWHAMYSQIQKPTYGLIMLVKPTWLEHISDKDQEPQHEAADEHIFNIKINRLKTTISIWKHL